MASALSGNCVGHKRSAVRGTTSSLFEPFGVVVVVTFLISFALVCQASLGAQLQQQPPVTTTGEKASKLATNYTAGAANSNFNHNNKQDDDQEEELRISSGTRSRQQQTSGGEATDLWPSSSSLLSYEASTDGTGQSLASSAPLAPLKMTKKRENELVDPFVFTFEDYLREASGATGQSQSTSGNHHNSHHHQHHQHHHNAPTSNEHSSSSASSSSFSGTDGAADESGANLVDNQSDSFGGRSSGVIIESDDGDDADSNSSRGSNNLASVSNSHRQHGGGSMQSNNGPDYIFPAPSRSSTSGRGKFDETDDNSNDGGKRVASASAIDESRRQGNNNNNDNNNNYNYKREPEAEQQQQQFVDGDEIKLLFSWRLLPTNKCSRQCGRGFRLNHLSCLDLKYNVRVEDELCRRAQLVRPNELSLDEPCNEVDCEPQWSEVEFRQCNDDSGNDFGDNCARFKLLKRLECTMINRRGQTVQLDESRCSNSSGGSGTTDKSPPSSAGSEGAGPMDELSIDLNEQLDKERNRILSSELLNEQNAIVDETAAGAASKSHLSHNHYNNGNDKHGGQLDRKRHQHQHRQHSRSNEPFWEASEWSECTGAPCGQLGRRSRKLTCRLYLARSAKHVDLPESACATTSGAAGGPDSNSDRPAYLDREQPCYMDCGPGSGVSEPISFDTSATPTFEPASSDGVQRETSLATDNNDDDGNQDVELTIETLAGRRKLDQDTQDSKQKQQQHEYKVAELEDDQDVVYDLDDLARYKWRHATDWTKCSADCLGGISESLVECWDRVANTSVDQTYCETRQKHQAWAGPRPAPLQRACNEIPCAPEWRLGPFSECSRPCGSAGTRSRSIACVQRVPPRGHSNYLLVSNDLCIAQQQQQQQQLLAANGAPTNSSNGSSTNTSELQPHQIEPCNRHDCRPEWSVGPWSECSRKCGEGVRNRTVICVQEFASQWGPLGGAPSSIAHTSNGNTTTLARTSLLSATTDSTTSSQLSISPDLREAISLAATSWHPGKATQVPFSECYREYHSVPQISEHCGGQCHEEPFIDADPLQDYRMILSDGSLNTSNMKRRTVTLKVGGRAQLLEGRTVKIRCRVLFGGRPQQNIHHKLVNNETINNNNNRSAAPRRSSGSPVEWRKDGVRIFAPGTTMAEKVQIIPGETPFDDPDEADNSIFGAHNGAAQNALDNELILNMDDKYSLMAADEPPEAKRARQRANSTTSRRHSIGSTSGQRAQVPPTQKATTTGAAKTRNLSVRSWSSSNSNGAQADVSFYFVPTPGGRFTLVKENTLRIKRLRQEDSGIYTCSSTIAGQQQQLLSESIEINVVAKRRDSLQLTTMVNSATGSGSERGGNNQHQHHYANNRS